MSPLKGSGTALAILAVVCVLTLAVGVGSTPLWDPDEPRFAAATRDMIATGGLLSPVFNGQPRFEKPILFYWLQLPFFLTLGATETAARLPSVLAGFGCILLLYLTGRLFFRERAALLGGLALATMFRFVTYARQGLTDVPAMFFEMAALYGFLRGSSGDARATGYTMAGWVAIGLCALTKGPVAIIPLAIWAAYLTVTRDRAAFVRWHVIPGVLVAAAVCLPWFVMMTAVHGRDFLDLAIGYEVVQRVIDFPVMPRSFWYYARIWPADALPWTIFGVLGCVHGVWAWSSLDRSVRRGLALCAVWFGVVLLLFSLASGKLPHYILPLYAPLALVTGFYIDRVTEGSAMLRPWQYAAALTGTVVVVVSIVTGLFLMNAAGISVFDVGLLLPALLAIGGVTVIACAIRGRPLEGTSALTATLAITYAFLAAYTVPRQLGGLYPNTQLGRILADVVAPADRVGIYGTVSPPTLAFYSRRVVEPLASPMDVQRFLNADGRVFCVVSQRDVPALTDASARPLYEIARRPKLVVRFNRLFARRPADAYDSDVVLLTNQRPDF